RPGLLPPRPPGLRQRALLPELHRARPLLRADRHQARRRRRRRMARARLRAPDRDAGRIRGRRAAGRREVLLSDAIVVVRDDAGDDEQEMARQFVPMLGTAYRALERPPVEFRDWPWRAERTLADLVGDKRATVTHRGCRFVMPYVEGEVPDSMVQLTVLASLHDYGKWRGEPVPLEAELRKGLELFHDPKRETLMRFVPGLEGGKDPGEVDSWYLYHPLINLARLALDGDEEARRLLLGSVGFGVRAAHHFDYRWPILYRIED